MTINQKNGIMKNILLQGASSDFGLDFFKLLIFLGVLLAVFLVLRALVLWYWKIDTIVANQQYQIEQNKKLIEQQGLIIDELISLNDKNKSRVNNTLTDI